MEYLIAGTHLCNDQDRIPSCCPKGRRCHDANLYQKGRALIVKLAARRFKIPEALLMPISSNDPSSICMWRQQVLLFGDEI